MSFFINFTIPSTGKTVRLQELSFKKFKILNKFLINQNSNHINECFDNMLIDSLIEKQDFTSFNNFDKFCALFLLRCTCISPDVEFKDGVMAVKKPLVPFLARCLDIKFESLKTIYIGDLEIKLSLPSSLFFDDLFEAYFGSITDVYLKGKKLQMDSSNKQEIIEKLPAEVTALIKEHSENINNMFSNLVFDVFTTGKDDSTLTLSPYTLSLFEILKALYATDLKNIFELQYVLVNKLRYSAEYVDNSTLIDNLIVFNIYQQEVEKANKEQAKIDKRVSLNK